jgi:carboxyl-terminal processing protease
MNPKTNRATFAVAAVLVTSATLIGSGVSPPLSPDVPPSCQSLSDTPPSPGPPEVKPTTITTIGQAYYCILDNYYRGPVLDDRSLLVPAFAALTQELQRRGLDQPGATLPALTGKNDQEHRDRNWAAFSQVYEQITAGLPPDPAVWQAVAEATMQGMVRSLNDSHADWLRSFRFNLTGLTLSGFLGPMTPDHLDPAALEPNFVTAVGGPAKSTGIRLGDEVLAVNGVPLFTNQLLSAGVLRWLTDATPGTPVEVSLRRPATDATFTVTLIPAQSPPPPPNDESRLVNGDIAYVKLSYFAPGAADRALANIAELRKNATLRGVILDLRGNTGGVPDERARLLGAFVHNAVTHYWCDAKDHCTPIGTDDSVALLNLPLVVLTDRTCASACDSFANGVKDLQLGTLVGTRTAGAASGAADVFGLDDGSGLMLPKLYEIGANKEIINTIGVAPDYYAPMTAADLSAGRDPGLAKAVELLR